MFDARGAPRSHYRSLHDVLATLGPADYRQRSTARDRSFMDQGVIYAVPPAESASESVPEPRPFPLDLVPRVLPAEEWAVVEAGVVQRVRALEAFLADVYGPGEVFRDGVLTRRLVLSSPHFRRQVANFSPPDGVRIQVAGIDLVRNPDGRFQVLEDNVRTPSGISYVIENRRAMTHVFPELFASYRVRSVADYPARLLEALRATAPRNAWEGREPVVVVLTPGVHNSAYFEHTFLARQMGVALVEGRDLICRDGIVAMRTTAGEQRVDVVYRRVDDEFLDPLQFRPDSMIGCPGIVNAARLGQVTIANAVGNGIADDKALYPFVPDLIRYYLGENPRLANVDTWLLSDPDQRAWVLDRLDQLVVKPVDGSGGYGLVIGPQASDEQLDALRRRVLANPRGWIAQMTVSLSTSPTYTGTRFEPRHVDLRPFAVNDGTTISVVPGGLTRVALGEGSLVVNSSQGGGSKDTWVLSGPGRPRTRAVAAERLASDVWTRPPEPGPQLQSSLATQQQQQQQQQDLERPC
ncbi:MAG: circularly permuted type 2 ATP-grasp protein [Acidimicrobiaceae bacterium]|nr:circularly permuted type 2 ATP-grasp protein [Acidimicrobiaceae bacterium]